MSDDSAFLLGFGGELVASLMALVHGWAWAHHTDGTIELRRDRPVLYCPECAQDQAFGRVTFAVGSPVP